MKQKGFTLAEVLVTMSVIGIVSALTLPSLMSNYQNKVNVTSLRKTVNTVTNAVALYMADNEISDLTQSDLYNSQDGLIEFVNNYFMVQANCGTKYYDRNKCFAKTYYSLDKSSSVNMAGYQCMYVVTLNDGMALCLDSGAMNSTAVNEDINGDGVIDSNDVASSSMGSATTSMSIAVEVDINGVNGPNVSGRDFFSFAVNSSGRVHDPNYNMDNDTYSGWTKSKAVSYPIGRIIANGWKLVD